jgi:hypothetical protein
MFRCRLEVAGHPKKPHHVLFLKHYLGKVDETWRPYLFMD